MARSVLFTWALIFVLVFASSALTSQAARMLRTTPSEAKERLFLAALPKGTLPSSTPSKKGHAAVVHQKLSARHLIESVPSPGVGH